MRLYWSVHGDSCNGSCRHVFQIIPIIKGGIVLQTTQTIRFLCSKYCKYYVIPKGQKCVRYPEIVDSSELYRLLYVKNPIKWEIFFAYQLLIATIPIEFLASKNPPYRCRSGVFFLLEEVDSFGNSESRLDLEINKHEILCLKSDRNSERIFHLYEKQQWNILVSSSFNV